MGFVAFLVFVAMAAINESWAGPHERGDDLEKWPGRKKKHPPLPRG